MPPPKINMYGGVLTISYNLAKCLRGRGKDVTLFVDKRHDDRSYSPIWEDEELTGNYPGWIKVTDAEFGKALFGDRVSRDFAGTLSDCDILHLHGEAYLWANIINKPFVYHSYGYDLDQLPFKKNSFKSAIIAWLSRRAIRRAGRILIAPHQQIFLDRLGVGDRGSYLPFPVDTDKYRPVNADELRKKILLEHSANLIFFHPTRHEWMNNSQTSNKANDKVLRAFSLYSKVSRNKAVLVLVEKGTDVAPSKELIDRLCLRDKVVWLKPMPKESLIKYYNASDLVLDQFSLGSFGQTFLESMACGRPTFIYLKGYERLYPEAPPVINVFTAEDIAEKMAYIAGNADKAGGIGRRSRAWVEKYHGWQNVCDRLFELYGGFMKEYDKC